MDSSHVLIQLRNEEDFLHTWARKGRSIAGSIFRLFKWTVDFNIHRESSIAPQWIFLPGLPLHLYRVDCLKILASRFGRYLGTDHVTLNRTRATGARICVETDLRAEPVEGFPIRFPTRTFSHEVKYEKLDFYCNRCGRQGHPEFACRVDQPKKVPGRKWTSEEKGKAKMEWKRKEMGTLEEKQIEAGKENMRSADIVIKTDVRKEETDYAVDNSQNVEVLPEGDHGETGNYSGSQDREHAVEMNDKELGELFIEHEQAQVLRMWRSMMVGLVINDEDVEEERAINAGSDCEISEVRGDACDQREKDYMSDTEINKIATGQGAKRLTLRRGSKFWKSIVDVLPEVAANCQWKINEGNISFWFSHWMPNGPLCNQVTNINQPGLRIYDVCLESGWDIERLHELVGEEGIFTSRSAWDMLSIKAPDVHWAQWVWNKAIPKRVSVVMWKALSGSLSVDSSIRKVGIAIASKCNCCLVGHEENTDHVLSTGDFADEVWKKLSHYLGLQWRSKQGWWERVPL
ncbi:unnamed protein product [Fraxinus pennsylvanica]|uniref:Reverse transcriptase zinc-binding domain-containing protein n=1 Tax=Fraxinus pennsylvanica TaxID=56036 RepID=A0AAD1ZSG6_9LAMI|nr:unnamed protein product [Fraxinus pennsylvanica]